MVNSLVLAGCRYGEMRFHAGEQGAYNQTLFPAPFTGDVASSLGSQPKFDSTAHFANLPLISRDMCLTSISAIS